MCRVVSPQVVQVRDLLHAEPAELAATDSAGHVVTAAVVHLDDVSAAPRARLDVISWGRETKPEVSRRERDSSLYDD